MKIKKIAALLLICITVTGCAGKRENVTIENYVSENVPMSTYGKEWILEHESNASDLTEDEFNVMYYYADYALDRKQFEAYFHKPEEYRDKNGNFVNPSSNAMSSDWKNIGAVSAEEVADEIIPKEIMDKMTTMELLQTAILEKSIVIQPDAGMYYEPYYLEGLSRSSTYREFLSRDDYAQTLYEFYMSIDPEEYIGTDFRKQAADMRSNSKSFVKISGIQFIEVTMATDEFYESLTKAGRQNIIKKSQEISGYISENDVCNTCASMWSCYSKSGYNAFEATVKKYDVTPKWKSFMEE